MDRPTGTSVFVGLLTAVSFLIVLFGIGFALYSLSEWMTTGRLLHRQPQHARLAEL